MILLKNDEVIDFLTSLPTNFSTLKYVQAEMIFNFQLAAGQLSRFITKDQWPPNSPDLNPMDYYLWGAMLDVYRKLKTKPKTIAKLN